MKKLFGMPRTAQNETGEGAFKGIMLVSPSK